MTTTSKLVSTKQISPARETSFRWPWVMLFSRITLFAGVQTLFAAIYFLIGSVHPWDSSANWWMISVGMANLIGLALLVKIFKTEGKRYWDVFRFDRAHVKGDLLGLLIVTLLAAPLSYFPNVMLAQWLFGSPDATLDLFVRPLPLWAAYTAVVFFPVTQGLTELATYFGYVMPRFESQGMNKWLAISLPALMLGLQHLAAPLLFDVRFIVWRGLMFIPFALMTGIALHARPRILPYFAIIHVLMNMSFATMFLSVAY